MANTNRTRPQVPGNGPLSNMGEFAKVRWQKGEAMVREQACRSVSRAPPEKRCNLKETLTGSVNQGHVLEVENDSAPIWKSFCDCQRSRCARSRLQAERNAWVPTVIRSPPALMA